MTPPERNGTLTKAVISILVALVIGLSGWSMMGLSEAQRKIVRLETRQEQVDRTLDALVNKVNDIHEWVLRQRGAQENRTR